MEDNDHIRNISGQPEDAHSNNGSSSNSQSGSDSTTPENNGLLSKEAKKALEEVKEESERQVRLYETIISSTPDLIYVFDLDYHFTFVNDALLEMWGLTHEESIGKTLLEVGYERWHAEMHKREIDEVIETKKTVRGEVPFPHARHGERIYDYIFVPVLNDEGEVEAVAGTTRDITEFRKQEQKRVRMEDALRKSEKKYRTLFESLDEGFCILNIIFNDQGEPVDYLYEEVNPAFKDQTGLKEVEGKKISEIDPNHEPYWFNLYGKVAKSGEPARFTRFAMGKLFDVYAFPIEEEGDDEGNFKVASIFNDITNRRRAEEEREELLREVETERQRLAEIFQHAPSFMCILRGPDHVFERANDLYYKVVGDRDIIGKAVREAIPEAESQGFLELLDRVYESGEAYSASDQRVVLGPGKGQGPEERFIDFVYQPLRDSSGEVTGIFVQGVDLTERKKAQKDLQEINETLEERVEKRTASLMSYQEQLRTLASKLSKAEEKERHRLATELHDNLGQMLAVNKMKVDLLPKDQLPNEVVADIEDIKAGMDEALVYTRDLMSDLKPPPSLDKEDIRATIEWLAEKMEKHDLEVAVNDDGRQKRSSEEIRTTLLQCVRELLFNVIKHTQQRKASVQMSRLDGHVEVVVEDDGKGFNPDNESSAPTEAGGFGLFNIRERMDLLGGNMKIDSKPGQGTKIILTAPVKEEVEAEMAAQSDEKGANATGNDVNKRIKVLLADDHRMIREGLRKIVDSEEDLQVIGEAADGQEAVELAQKTTPDIIVMDVNMPRMNGIDATHKIVSQMPDVRIVGLSLHDHKEVIESMRNAGASAYLTKNEAFETLCATIRSEAKLTK